jgi:hypothetical protein
MATGHRESTVEYGASIGEKYRRYLFKRGSQYKIISVVAASCVQRGELAYNQVAAV